MPMPIMEEKVHSARMGNIFFIILVFSLPSNANEQIAVFYNLPLRQEDRSKKQIKLLRPFSALAFSLINTVRNSLYNTITVRYELPLKEPLYEVF